MPCSPISWYRFDMLPLQHYALFSMCDLKTSDWTKFSGSGIECPALALRIAEVPDSSELCAHSLDHPRESAWKQMV